MNSCWEISHFDTEKVDVSKTAFIRGYSKFRIVTRIDVADSSKRIYWYFHTKCQVFTKFRKLW